MSRSGIVQPDVYSYKDPDAIFPYGMALVTNGLVNIEASNGYGLVSRGFLWQLYDVWLDYELYDNISSSWSDANALVTTSWAAAAGSSVSTSWGDVQYGIWGEYTPETPAL